MTKNCLRLVGLIGAIAVALACSGAEPTKGAPGMITWPGSPEFETKTRSFALSPEDAHDLLLKKIGDRPDRFVDPSPLFIVDQTYFFTEPDKTEIRLQGFYVDGMTGRIEHRTSNHAIRVGSTRLPPQAFDAVTILGNEP